MAQGFTRTGAVSAAPAEVFDAWIDAAGHAAMTGAPASSEPVVGGAFSAWDGYITGAWTALDRPRRLAFTWRTTQFPEDAPDSRVEVTLTEIDGGCEVSIAHHGIPLGQPDYDQGWEEFYLEPMRRRWA
jgi:uncharacterized protein YndB with AHSA1/START domain